MGPAFNRVTMATQLTRTSSGPSKIAIGVVYCSVCVCVCVCVCMCGGQLTPKEKG